MKNDKKWLRESVNELKTTFNGMKMGEYETGRLDGYSHVSMLIDHLDEPEKPIIPKFVADWIDVLNLHGNNPLREYRDLENDFDEGWTNEEDAEVYHWINKNPYAFIDSLRYGYEVEKEILWEIPMPDLKTSDGHIQYLTYDPKARTYFGSRQNGRLKQTFNAKDLASVPGQYRRYAELCDFKKIEEATE